MSYNQCRQCEMQLKEAETARKLRSASAAMETMAVTCFVTVVNIT